MSPSPELPELREEFGPNQDNVEADDIIAKLKQRGFTFHRHGKGHAIYKISGLGPQVVIPRHKGETIKPGTLKSILEQAELALNRS